MRLAFSSAGTPIPPSAIWGPQSYIVDVPDRGMGTLDPQSQQIAGIAATGASTATALLGAFGVIGGPVGIAIGGMIQLGLALANVFSGCGQTCVQASNIANQVSSYLDQLFWKYMNSPVHYASMQSAFLASFDSAWAALEKACSDPNLQAAGQRCISDRQSGACTWKASPGGWSQDSTGKWTFTPYGPAGSGNACWNWFSGYRDLVANDPTVVPDPPVTSDLSTVLGGSSGTSGTSSFPVPLLIGAGLIAAIALTN